MPIRRILPLLILLTLTTAPTLAQDQTLDRLGELFEKDPAAAFDWAERLFAQAAGDEDLDRMVQILNGARPQLRHYNCGPVIDRMTGQTALLAKNRGEWGVLGDILWKPIRERAGARPESISSLRGRTMLYAAECYAKAGTVPADLENLLPQARAAAEKWRRRFRSAVWWDKFPAQYRPVIGVVGAAGEVVDPAEKAAAMAEAVTAAKAMLEQLASQPRNPLSPDDVNVIQTTLTAVIDWPGGEELIPLLFEPIHDRDGKPVPSDIAVVGGDDRYLAYWHEALRRFNNASEREQGDAFNLHALYVPMAHKMGLFGHHADAIALMDQWLRRNLASIGEATFDDHRGFLQLHPVLFSRATWPWTPAPQRRGILGLWSQIALLLHEEYPQLNPLWTKGHPGFLGAPVDDRIVLLKRGLQGAVRQAGPINGPA
ncbi:MAG: hypothetical protein QGI33_05780, partial [Candidatus Brocadiia bacterium]|nr:hypothetical protein [Candidatus Brocadiia bacterium]